MNPLNPAPGLDRRRRAQPDRLGADASAVSPAMRDLGIEIDAVAGFQLMPDAADFDLDLALQYHDAVFALMGKQRPALGAGRSFDPQQGRAAPHVRRQQFVVDIGAGKRELLSFGAPGQAASSPCACDASGLRCQASPAARPPARAWFWEKQASAISWFDL
jgi:hypothetical protein